MKYEAVMNLLTPCEREVYFHLLSKLTLEQIAGEIGSTYHAVRFHCTNIYSKCGVKNRLELATTFNDKNIPLLIFKLYKQMDEMRSKMDALTILPKGNL